MRTPGRNASEGQEGGGAGQPEVAAYVAALSADLSALSRKNGLATLAYLLDMASLEADSVARSARGDGSS